MEAESDDRLYAHHLRPGVSVCGRSVDSHGAVFDEHAKAAAAERPAYRTALLQRRAPATAAAERKRLHDLQGRLASGGSAGAELAGRMAMDEEDRDARVQEPEKRRAVLSGIGQSRSGLQRHAAGGDRRWWPPGPGVHIGSETGGPQKNSIEGDRLRRVGDGRVAD